MGIGWVVHADCSGRPRCQKDGGPACSQSCRSTASSEPLVEVCCGPCQMMSPGYPDTSILGGESTGRDTP